MIENRRAIDWIAIMIAGWLIYSFLSGVLIGVYIGVTVAGPLATEMSESAAANPNATELSDDQVKHLEGAMLEQMRQVDWWLWWPLLNSVAWAIAAAFLGFMKVVKFNEALVAVAYIPVLLVTSEEWQPPDSFAVEGLTILLALAIVHTVSRWACQMRVGVLPPRT